MSVFQPNIPGLKKAITPEALSFLSSLKLSIISSISDPLFDSKALAHSMKLKPEQLARQINNLTSYSAAKLIRHMRVEYAMTLLKETQLPVKVISRKAGFLEHSNFCRCFRKHYQKSPTQMRRQNTGVKRSFEFYCNSPFRQEDLTFIAWLMEQQVWLKELITQTLQRIEDERIDIESLASSLSMSPSQLNRKLKQALKLTTRNFIKNIRLQLAAELLIYKQGSLSTIGLKAGFFDHPHFCRSFKLAYGMSPGAYRSDPANASLVRFTINFLNTAKNDN